ncbi:hypothetical protein ACFQJC_17160 [Haloferax namakaokahaiae]|uniref:Uncharacterized protein n=1 Tax=Haloferax namakaokahaiae TaxID=1748331 RepID=A0ABD5ZJQ4_9EURY
MNNVQQNQATPRLNRLGGILTLLALVTVVISYPPPATGVKPLFGFGNMFLPLFMSALALVVAIIGGTLLARNIASAQTGRVQRLAITALIPASAVAVVGVYLAVTAGFDPNAPIIIGVLAIAAVGGLTNELVN